ncbi:anti-sigma factor domain-containing protein [Bacillus cereus group sp. BfR-BA-01331]|uniref:anti-sigma factor domain-containing protein n=1 Tax=Bacillus cereus group sp. BfR-BA-01331 TaxID=2920307 RepID=UPI002413A0BD|nr:anti-sigma factor domain-containing protein [Bacillus cereus group sp. BfR-BA-01331]
MNKGIVMDIKKHSVVVLTPNGEFITFKRKAHPYMIGEEILFNKQEQRAPRFSMPPFLKPTTVIVAGFLCVLLFFYNQPEEKVFAYVSVDINPSLEASVTEDLRVIDLRACNDDGRRILKEMKGWENKHLQDVIRTIIKQSQEDKYLTNDKQVMLTAVAKDKSLEPQLEKVMQELKKEYEIKHITVEYQSSTMQMREDAKKAGVGTGVYIKQENEKKKSLTPPAPPSNQEQQKSSSDASSDASPVNEESNEKKEHIEQKQSNEQQPKQIKENNGNQQENNGRGSQGNNGNGQGNNGRGSQGNNGNGQGNNGRESQGNNGNGQGNNGRGSQGNNGNQQGNNGRESQGNNGNGQGNNGRESQGNNGNGQGNKGRESQGNNGNGQGNKGRESQGNNGNQQENNGRGSQGNNGNQQENNGRGSQGNNGN